MSKNTDPTTLVEMRVHPVAVARMRAVLMSDDRFGSYSEFLASAIENHGKGNWSWTPTDRERVTIKVTHKVRVDLGDLLYYNEDFAGMGYSTFVAGAAANAGG